MVRLRVWGILRNRLRRHQILKFQETGSIRLRKGLANTQGRSAETSWCLTENRIFTLAYHTYYVVLINP